MSQPVKKNLRVSAAEPAGEPANRTGASAIGAPELIAAARRRFLACERIRLEEIAAELGVSRASAYRWVGNAEHLTGLVIAGLVDETHARTLREAGDRRGADRIIDATARGLHYISTSKPYHAFLARDPQKALRIAASKEGPVQARTIAHHEALIREEIARGHLASLPVDPHTMAYALVRVAESFLYADIIAGEEPDLDKAVEIIRLLLAGC